MKKKNFLQTVLTVWVMAVCWSIALTISALAQTNDATIPAANAAGSFATAQFWIDLATPFIGPLLMALIKRYWETIPSVLIPPAAIALAVLGNALGTVVIAGGNMGTPMLIKSVALGLAGIGVRELTDQVKQKLIPPSTATTP